MDEKKILDFITSDSYQYSWEQIIYEVIAWEGLNPWDLDITKLSNGFVKYLNAMKEMDFRVPARYIMVASILLRMKSDYLRAFKEQVTGQVEEDMQKMEEGLEIEGDEQPFEISPINIPPRREPVKGVMITDLVRALKKVLKSHERKVSRKAKLRKDIDISGENINERIRLLYRKIGTILKRVDKREVRFSRLVGKWDREEIIRNFVPLVHLEQQKMVKSRQEKVFEEIWVSRREKK